MSIATEAELQATGLPENCLATYRLVHAHDPPLLTKDAATRLGKSPATVKRHLSNIRLKIADPEAAKPHTGSVNIPDFYDKNPDKFGEALMKLSAPGATAAQVARDLGISPDAALNIGKKLDGELQPLKRVVTAVRVDDLAKKFGSLSNAAIDAITDEKLEAASASQLAVVAGIAGEKYLLMNGQPTARVEIGDRRQMDEVLKLLLKEARRRGVEIDVTPEGAVTAGKSKYKNAHHRRDMLAIGSGDAA